MNITWQPQPQALPATQPDTHTHSNSRSLTEVREQVGVGGEEPRASEQLRIEAAGVGQQPPDDGAQHQPQRPAGRDHALS